MATPADNPPPSSELPSTSPPPQPPEPTPTSAPVATQQTTPTPTDPLTALGTMWTGWLSQTTSTTPATAPSSTSTQTTTTAEQSAPTTDWLSGAGKMFESAVADVGSKLKSVDTSALNEQVAVIRQKSGRILEDVSRSVQSMHISIDQADLQSRAQEITQSTKGLFEKAGQSLQQGRQEALEIFVDRDDKGHHAQSGLAVAPWDVAALPEGERAFADALRQEMLKIVVDAIYSKKKRTDLFLSGVAERESFQFDFDKHSAMAMAALDADKNMRRLRAGLVPGKMKEDAFWNTYFYHVHRVRQTLVANNGVMPEAPPEEDDDDPAALFADDGEDEELAALNSPGIKAAPADTAIAESDKPTAGAGGNRNWDDEIDAIFDGGDD